MVIGGGMAGLTACTSLRKHDKMVEIVLVEPKDYMEVHWASYRSIFDPEMAASATFDLKKWAVPRSVTIIRSTVTQLTPTEATLANGSVVEFNVAIICTGAQMRFPAMGRGPPSGKTRGSGDRQRRLAQLKSESNKFLGAKSVVIVGGGLVGAEFAGDLAYFAKQKSKSIDITLVHAKEYLCDREMTPKASAMVKKKLEAMGVQVFLNDKVIKNQDQLILQSSSMVLDADQVAWTTGITSCNSFLDSSFLDRRGWIEVDEYFRVKGAEKSLFSLGDCCDLLPNAGSQILGTMGVIGKNIAVTLDAIQLGNFDNVEKKMRRALAQPEIFVTTLGKQTGVAQTPCGHTQFVMPWLKNSSMFLFKPKGDLGLKD